MGSKQALIYSVVIIAISSIICFMAYQLDNTNVAILTVLTPSILAVIMTWKSEGSKGVKSLLLGQLLKRFKVKWFLISLLGVPVCAFIAILINSNFDIFGINLRTTQLVPQIIIITIIGFGEEYGWRGYLMPALLKEYSLFYSSLIVGTVWGLWHFPAYLIGTGVPLEMNFLVFFLWVILASIFMGWIYYHTKSVLTAIIIHIVANATFNFFYLLPEFTGNMNTFLIFQCVLIVFILSLYIVIMKPYKKKPVIL